MEVPPVFFKDIPGIVCLIHLQDQGIIFAHTVTFVQTLHCTLCQAVKKKIFFIPCARKIRLIQKIPESGKGGAENTQNNFEWLNTLLKHMLCVGEMQSLLFWQLLI